MLTAATPAEQHAAAERDPLRVLIVGAGIAGVTLAGLLRRQGLHPVLLERAEERSVHAGYMLALMPMVDPVLDELSAHERYRSASVPFDRYRIRSHTGRLLRDDSMGSVLARYGDYRGLDRASLIEVLSTGGVPVAFGTTVSALHEHEDGIRATITGDALEQELEFDVVVIADGMHSRTRALALRGRGVQTVDTGWGGWVAWAPADDDPGRGEELWGDGFFVGSYPVPGRIGVFVGGPNDETAAGPGAFVARIRAGLRHDAPRIDAALDAVATADEPYYWPMADCRAGTWRAGRAVLLGDAAAGFMPTAGIGAGMAMESAGVLAAALRGARPAEVPDRLAEYERRQRPRVESAQDNSRALARLMFRRGRLFAALRDAAARVVSVGVALGPIRRLLETAPAPLARTTPEGRPVSEEGRSRSR